MTHRQVRLDFRPHAREAGTHTNLSAVRSEGRVLWVAGDETATVERLVAEGPAPGDDATHGDAGPPSSYGSQTTYRLADLVDLPGPPDDEADVEGLARSGAYLWAVGSHSLKRKKVKDKHDDRKALERLATVVGEANRQVLVRVPVVTVDALPALVREAEVDGERRVAAAFGSAEEDLRTLLADDEHLGPFLPLPGKDNGLDIEGIAVTGERVFLGLRGPVLRGWAFVLELRPRADPDDPTRLRLTAFDDGRPYRKHALDLGGLGVRDLCPDGDDLLVLTGPTMDLDGPVRVVRWVGAGVADVPDVVRAGELRPEVDLPYGEGEDHAEGIAFLPGSAGGELMVVYDSPSAARLGDDGSVLADVVRLP